MIKFFSILLFLLIAHNSISQSFVPNGGFESYSSLPNFAGQYYKSTGWSNVNGSTTLIGYGSPDYFHTSGSVPTTFGQIAPNSGNGQMGFLTYKATNIREYLSTQLTNPLLPGNTYQLSFYLTNGYLGNSTARADNFGIHLSVGSLSQLTTEVIQLVPTFEIPGVISHSNYWQLYTFTFVASNAATHITFGNFENDANTTITGSLSSNAYYFIDDIELVPLTSLSIELVNFIVSADENNTVNLLWKTKSEEANDFFLIEKSLDGINWERLEKVPSLGNSNELLEYSTSDYQPYNGLSYYRLSHTDKNSMSRIISLKSLELVLRDVPKLYPNPTRNKVLLTNYNENIVILDIEGKDVTHLCSLSFLHDNQCEIDMSNLDSGLYILKSTSYSVKIIKN